MGACGKPKGQCCCPKKKKAAPKKRAVRSKQTGNIPFSITPANMMPVGGGIVGGFQPVPEPVKRPSVGRTIETQTEPMKTSMGTQTEKIRKPRVVKPKVTPLQNYANVIMSEKISIPKKKFVKEHTGLVNILKNGSDVQQKKEAASQQKELNKVLNVGDKIKIPKQKRIAPKELKKEITRPMMNDRIEAGRRMAAQMNAKFDSNSNFQDEDKITTDLINQFRPALGVIERTLPQQKRKYIKKDSQKEERAEE